MRYTPMLAAALLGLASVAGAQETTQPPARLPATTITAANANAVTVQNDRHETVRFYLESGRADKVIGTVAANSTEQLQLPSWAVAGKRSITVLAVAEASTRPIARYEIALDRSRVLGLLVPPAEGLPRTDSILINLPKGIGSAATVTIDNARSQPVTVFAEQGLRFVRLGDVAANQQGTLALPKTLLSGKDGVRIFARPVGAAERSTQALKLREGDHISVIVM
jgi:hypothetical protein